MINQVFFKERKKQIAEKKKKKLKEFQDSDDEKIKRKKKLKTWIVYEEFFRSEDFVLSMQPEKMDDEGG